MPRPAASIRALPAESGALLTQPTEADVNCARWSEFSDLQRHLFLRFGENSRTSSIAHSVWAVTRFPSVPTEVSSVGHGAQQTGPALAPPRETSESLPGKPKLDEIL